MKLVHYYASPSLVSHEQELEDNEALKATTSKLTSDMLSFVVNSHELGVAPWITLLPLEAYYEMCLNMAPFQLKLFNVFCFSDSDCALSELHIITPKIMITIHYKNGIKRF